MDAILPRLALPLLRRIDAERAHRLALLGLRWGLGACRPTPREPRLGVNALGLHMAWPVGLAAGFDKDAESLRGLARLGFASLEAGTVTMLAQPGQARPRLFRLPEEAAAINRMGFNNCGIEAFARRLRLAPRDVPLGVNVGLNRDGAEPSRDFPRLVDAVRDRADWVTINLSSPNTPGIRDLQAPRRLAEILRAVVAGVPARPPLLVKLAPDLDDADLPAIVEACIDGGVAGLVVCNTTTARPAGLRGRHAGEAGGLSGKPLMRPSTALLARIARLGRGRLVLVGVGGVASGEDVLAKLRAGASFVQIYTAFALQGPALLPKLRRDFALALDRAGLANAQAAIGAGL